MLLSYLSQLTSNMQSQIPTSISLIVTIIHPSIKNQVELGGFALLSDNPLIKTGCLHPVPLCTQGSVWTLLASEIMRSGRGRSWAQVQDQA